MQPPYDPATLRELIRKYKRTASRLRDGLDELGEFGNLRFSTNWKKGEGTTSAFNESDPLVRFAALLRPFMHAASALELRSVWAMLTSSGSLVDEATRETMTKNFVVVENLGIAVRLNQKDLTARDLYFAYAEG